MRRAKRPYFEIWVGSCGHVGTRVSTRAAESEVYNSGSVIDLVCCRCDPDATRWSLKTHLCSGHGKA